MTPAEIRAVAEAANRSMRKAAESMRGLAVLLRYHNEREVERLRYLAAQANPNLEPFCVTGHDGVTRVRVRRVA